jgi:hypothetical protein
MVKREEARRRKHERTAADPNAGVLAWKSQIARIPLHEVI